MGNVAGAVLGAIGGALEGTSNAWKQSSKMDDANDIRWNNLNGGKSAVSGAVKGYTNGLINVDGDSETSTNSDTDDKTDTTDTIDIKNLVSNVGSKENKAFSDEDLKQKYSKDANVILEAYKNLNAIIYRYNELAHQIQDDTGSIDNDIHLGVKAQDIEKQPILSSAVSTSENGYKEVDIKEMTLANTAAISELVKKVDKLYKVIGDEGKK